MKGVLQWITNAIARKQIVKGIMTVKNAKHTMRKRAICPIAKGKKALSPNFSVEKK